MERRVFLCGWQRSGAGYRVWVLDRPTLAAEGAVFDVADEALADAICGATGYGENVREYDPPRPREDQPGLLFRLVEISGERRGLIENAGELFSEDYCPQCKNPRGDRTAVPLRLARLEPGGNAGYATLKPAGFDGPFINFFSEEFVAGLLPQERSQFQWRPIHSPPRIKKGFVEIISPSVHVPFASLSGAVANLWSVPSPGEGHALWRCGTCGRTQKPIYWFRTSSLPMRYVNSADLPEPLPTCIGVGDRESPGLCFTSERWSALVNLLESRGLRSTDVGVVAPSLVDREPALRPL
jgi:hypothetical protein